MPGLDSSNYLIFSDVHLGADLVQHLRPWTRERLHALHDADRELAAMLAYYRAGADPAHPWRIVIAGDLVDFIGMSIGAPDASLPTALTDEERAHGLGSAPDHAATKMQAVIARHSHVFDELAALVADGHQLELVRGNHDLDFHWSEVQEKLVEGLLERYLAKEPAGDGAAFAARITFHPWFFYVEELLYVEHGHQFDPMCQYPHLLAPVSPHDPKRLHWTFSDLLLRLVALPTPGLGADGHGQRSIVDYVRFAFSTGLRGMLRLGGRYLRAIRAAMRSARAHVDEAAERVREEHERQMARLAETTRLGRERLEQLAALWPLPVTRGTWVIFRSVFFDRALLFVTSLLVLLGLPMLGAPLEVMAGTAVALFALYFGYAVYSTPRRDLDVDASETMIAAARKIVELLPARFVVMGHTHRAHFEALEDGPVYVNLGNWGEGEVGQPDLAKLVRTHFVLRWIDGEPLAELLRWDAEHGPRAAL